MNSEDGFFVLVCEFGGKVDYGFDGFVCVVSEIEKYASGKNSKHNLEQVLRKYFTNCRGGCRNLKEQWHESVELLQKTIENLKLQKSFKKLSQVLKDILGENWVCEGVNMSEVFKLILETKLPGNEDSAKRVMEKLENKTGNN
ncbi:hypothetical protein Zmor_007725 [Zophobas morio]|uniref:Uncharacterized protein n=1 Tax=Zophobas morio TaxID=2755281 RepID=A0AA38IY47_9CUCU|nr:hypothetical protein Zmor_007725 [Zophobas morio]